MLGCRFSFKAYAKNARQKATKWLLKTINIVFSVEGHALTHTLALCSKKFFLMSGMKFTLSDVISFLADNLSGL